MIRWRLRRYPEEPAPAFPVPQGSVPGRLRSRVWSVPVTLRSGGPRKAGRAADRLPLWPPAAGKGLPGGRRGRKENTCI